MYSSSLFTVTTSLYLFRGEYPRSLEDRSPEGTRPVLLPLPPLVRLYLFLPMRCPPYTAKKPGLLPSLVGVLEKPTATSSIPLLTPLLRPPSLRQLSLPRPLLHGSPLSPWRRSF